jgi:hypothetical protein
MLPESRGEIAKQLSRPALIVLAYDELRRTNDGAEPGRQPPHSKEVLQSLRAHEVVDSLSLEQRLGESDDPEVSSPEDAYELDVWIGSRRGRIVRHIQAIVTKWPLGSNLVTEALERIKQKGGDAKAPPPSILSG